MGCLAGIVETVGCAAATAPRKFESRGEGRKGSGTCGRLGRVGKLRCGVSFKFHHQSNPPSISIHPGVPGGPPCAELLDPMMSKFPTLTVPFPVFFFYFRFELQILVDGEAMCGCDLSRYPQTRASG